MPLGAARYLPRLLQPVADPRTTGEVRGLLAGQSAEWTCVWSGEPLVGHYEVDHLVPYAAWGTGDLWNLLPTLPALNNQKRDRLPTARLLAARSEAISAYWEEYRAVWPARFAHHLERWGCGRPRGRGRRRDWRRCASRCG